MLLYAVEKLRTRRTTGTHGKGAPVTTTAAHEDLEGDASDGGHLAAVSVPATMTATTASHRTPEVDAAADDRLGRRSWGKAIGIGAAQILALLPGFSRSGATIAAGLVRSLDHEDAARSRSCSTPR